jgi:hypothetical protein
MQAWRAARNLLLAGTGITLKAKTDVGPPLTRDAVEPINTGRVHEQHRNLG